MSRISRASLSRRTLVGSAAVAAASAPFMRSGSWSAFAQAEDQLEVFSWWTTGGEHAGLEELFKAFTAANPDVEIIDAAVAGGAGTNAQVALQTRLSANQPPDSWQSHPGAELWARYVEPGFCEPMTALWEEQGWNDVFPAGLIDQITFNDDRFLVPVGVHRGNVMFYNTALLEEHGITVAADWSLDDYFAAADTLQAAGVPAIAIGDGSNGTWTVAQLWENTLLGTLGPDDYVKVWGGEVAWDDDRVTASLEYLGRYLDSVNEDHAALTWDGAADLVYAGSAAFTSMGDWLYGDALAKSQDATLGYVAHPGTSGSFVSVIDGFTLPVGAPHPNNATNWLIAVGSAEAQTAFAPFKGAIPARSDADASGFNEYMQWSAADFGANAVVPSLAHGGAASPQFQTAVYEGLVTFLVDRDVQTMTDALLFAQEDEM